MSRSSIVFLVANFSHVVTVLKECSVAHGAATSQDPGSCHVISVGKMGTLAIKEYEVFSLVHLRATEHRACRSIC